MKKSSKYLFYYLVVFTPLFFLVSNNFLFKKGVLLVWAVLSLFALGGWWLIAGLLNRTEKRGRRYTSVVLASALYLAAIVALDFYVLHIILSFSGIVPWKFGLRMFIAVTTGTIVFENMAWAREREKAQIENLKLQAENIEAKFQLLQQKINPEFLFHCLATLQTMVKSDNPQTEDYILKLADVYRQTLKNQKNTISLKNELALLQNYLFLVRSGREAAISFEINILEESLNYELPIFALQTLADNCIKNNEFSTDKPLNIRVYQKEEESITITYNFQPKSTYAPFETTHLEMQYELEDIENGVLLEQNESIYSTTLQLF